MTACIEPALLRAQATRGGAPCPAREFAMHPLVSAVLLRTRRRDALMHDTELHPPDIQCRQAVNAVEANGAPLSVRMASGSPTRRKRARKMGFASTVLTERRPWHTSTRRLK